MDHLPSTVFVCKVFLFGNVTNMVVCSADVPVIVDVFSTKSSTCGGGGAMVSMTLA